MTEPTLFPDDDPGKLPPKLPHNRTVTSKLAAQSMRCLAGAQQQRVLECLQRAGDAGLTDEEIQTSLNLSGNSERPRRASLVALGLVRDSGVMRKTNANHAAVVWAVVTPDERPPVAAKSDCPTDNKTNQNKSAEPVLDYAI